jgi:hypothetical protein
MFARSKTALIVAASFLSHKIQSGVRKSCPRDVGQRSIAYPDKWIYVFDILPLTIGVEVPIEGGSLYMGHRFWRLS